MHCQINGVCKQDRKNYFYPDLPKAYQISQAEVPLCGKGYLDVMVDGQMKRIGVTRIHIEEDAGKLLHDESYITTGIAVAHARGIILCTAAKSGIEYKQFPSNTIFAEEYKPQYK